MTSDFLCTYYFQSLAGFRSQLHGSQFHLQSQIWLGLNLMRPRRTESPQCQAISCFQGNLIKVTPLKPTGFWLALRDSSNFRRGTGTRFVKKINNDQVRFQTSIEFQVHFQYQNFSSNSAPWFCSVVTWKTDLLNKSNSQARPWMWLAIFDSTI